MSVASERPRCSFERSTMRPCPSCGTYLRDRRYRRGLRRRRVTPPRSKSFRPFRGSAKAGSQAAPACDASPHDTVLAPHTETVQLYAARVMPAVVDRHPPRQIAHPAAFTGHVCRHSERVLVRPDVTDRAGALPKQIETCCGPRGLNAIIRIIRQFFYAHFAGALCRLKSHALPSENSPVKSVRCGS